ncbi:MAG: hypothetical protein RL318_1688 [Fibrobacterota bacterium]|jgi:uncharacterized membrane protein YfcA
MTAMLLTSLLVALVSGFAWERFGRLPRRWKIGLRAALLIVLGLILGTLAVGALFGRHLPKDPVPVPVDTNYRRNA